MNKIKELVKRELVGWKKWEVIWLLSATAVILGLSIYWGDNIISILAAVTGVWCVILTGKGKRSSFIFGSVNVVFYVILNLFSCYRKVNSTIFAHRKLKTKTILTY